VKTSEDKSRPSAQLPPSIAARCEGCGLAYELDMLELSPAELVDVCGDCGSPVYVVGPVALRDQAEAYLEAFGAGWDACAALMSTVATDGEVSD
jgi:hypothetical protein